MPKLLARIEGIAALRARILTASVDLPVADLAWIPALQMDALARNAHSSTAIEGNPLTLEQVHAVEERRALAAVSERARREVVNYFVGLRFIEKNLDKKFIHRWGKFIHRRGILAG
jgi:Fic family protein